jgi:hypothetical protein
MRLDVYTPEGSGLKELTHILAVYIVTSSAEWSILNGVVLFISPEPEVVWR